MEAEASTSPKTKKNSKKKYLPISELDNALLPGRNECVCEASVHELICNCLNCGRIVCEQEDGKWFLKSIFIEEIYFFLKINRLIKF